jgi:acyl-CoA reductase-like NAD-dependent aldehyde dehydrogenase
MFCSWKSGPALAAGNTVIIKPSEKSFLGTLAIASQVKAAGFPPGVFQVLIGDGNIGALLSSHMDIDKVSFTGSTATGRRIQEAATKSNLKRVTLELGGKGPALVFDDADLDKALFWVTLGITVNTGQVCAATSRLLVQKSIADSFLDKVKAGLGAMSQALGGDPQDVSTHYGPVVDAQQFQKVTDYIQEGKKRTKVLTGGQKYEKKGYYIAPTVFLDPEPDEKIWTEEIFGPVLCVKTFETEEEAIKLANDTQYGLSSAIFTTNIARALRIASSVRTGTVNVNCNLMVGNQAPMGGFGLSGVGRELGEYGLAQYTETKTIWVR